jgi:hypothetical protein
MMSQPGGSARTGSRGRPALFSEVELDRAQRRPNRHVGLDIDHKFRPLSGRLLANPLGHRGPLEFAQEPDPGRLSIECNDRLFRLWPIDVTDYRLK